MIRALIAIVLLIPLSQVRGGNAPVLNQNTSPQPVSQSSDDSLKIDPLLKLCWDNRNSNPESSVRYGSEAVELAGKYNDFYKLATAYSFLGVAYKVMGKYSEALDAYYKGLDVALKHEIDDQSGFAYLNLANLYVYQELTAMAYDNLRKAQALAEKTGNRKMMGYVKLYLGKVHSLTGKPDSAIICYNQSLLIRRELNQVAEEATCYKYIGDIYFMTKDYKSAAGSYNLSLEKVDKMNDRDLYANLLIDKSWILVHENKYSEAKTLSSEALEIGKEIRASKIIKDALQVLSEVSFRSNDFKTAADLQRKVIVYEDSLFSKQLSEKIFFLEYQKEREQREIRIDLLNRDNSIKELKLKRGRILSIGLILIVALMATVFLILLVLLKQRRRHEVLLEQHNRQLTGTNLKLGKSEEELKKIVQTKDKLLSIIAHDLRNPFTALIGLTDLLKENADTMSREELVQSILMIDESSHKLLLLIENLLAWARSQTGTLKPVCTDLNLRSQADDVINLYMSQAETKGITLINEIDENVTVFTDQKILATIIRNLVSNGIKYTRKGGSVTCSAVTENRNTVLKVRDTGVGMKDDLVKKLFRIDERVTTTGTGSESGTGLGLVICKEFIETLGGTITAESTPGAGSVFSVTIPATSV